MSIDELEAEALKWPLLLGRDWRRDSWRVSKRGRTERMLASGRKRRNDGTGLGRKCQWGHAAADVFGEARATACLYRVKRTEVRILAVMSLKRRPSYWVGRT